MQWIGDTFGRFAEGDAFPLLRAREARRVANESSDSLSPSTQPSMWSTSALPGDERNK